MGSTSLGQYGSVSASLNQLSVWLSSLAGAGWPPEVLVDGLASPFAQFLLKKSNTLKITNVYTMLAVMSIQIQVHAVYLVLTLSIGVDDLLDWSR